MNKYKITTIVGVVCILVLTFFRENFLLEINSLINNVTFHRASFYWFYSFFEGLDQPSLGRWKWGLTIFFSLVITFLTIGSLYTWFRSKELVQFISKLYFALFFFIVLLALLGFLFNSFTTVYPLLRKLLGIVQSPIPFFVFFLLFLNKNN